MRLTFLQKRRQAFPFILCLAQSAEQARFHHQPFRQAAVRTAANRTQGGAQGRQTFGGHLSGQALSLVQEIFRREDLRD